MPNWNDVLGQIHAFGSQKAAEAKGAVDFVRRQYLGELHKHTGRNVIAYYSGWLSKPGIAEADINDEDKNGFLMAVHKLDASKGLGETSRPLSLSLMTDTRNSVMTFARSFRR